MAAHVLFITGSDTGVGKTVLTCLLVSEARQRGLHALAIKPFCSGGREDAELLSRAQDHELPLDELNPFFFHEPVTPLVAARRWKKRIPLSLVLAQIRNIARRCDLLLVEGAGGLLAPLGENLRGSAKKTFSNLDVIRRLGCKVVIVAANKLGTINHTLLTIDKLRAAKLKIRGVVLSDALPGHATRARSLQSNLALLRECAPGVSVYSLPYFTCVKTGDNKRKKAAWVAEILRF